MRAVPTLKPKHFDGVTTMVGGGLHFKESLTIHDWIVLSSNIGSTFADHETNLLERAANRQPSWVELNPSTMSAKDLVNRCRASRGKQRTKNYFNVGYRLSESFDRKWDVHTENRKGDIWRKTEGQSLVLVAFDDRKEFVGHSSFKATCNAPIERTDKYSVSFEMAMVYVLPERRGVGYGVDLSIATGMVCEAIFRAYYRAVPSGVCLVPYIFAEYESKGGEAFTLHVRDQIDYAVDILREDRQRRPVGLSHTELCAGY